MDSSLLSFRNAEEAYKRIETDLDAINTEDLSPLNVDLVHAATVALRAAERIRRYRDRMARLGEFDVRNVDNLVDYARAVLYASMANPSGAGESDLAPLMKDVARLRVKLLKQA